MTRLDTATAGIAPSPHAGVGPNVIRAIAGYAGKPVALRRDGRDSTGHALIETRRYTIAPPGRLPLRSIRFSLVDVPDLRALPQLWPELRAVWIGVGPVPEVLHRGLNAMAWAVRLKLLHSLSPFAGPLYGSSICCGQASIAAACSSRSKEPGRTAPGSNAHGICWPRAMTVPSFRRWRWQRFSAAACRAIDRRPAPGRRRRS
ncbi:MAG: hypothetical protein ACREE7_07540 [Dongiaceae bacterium]